MFYRLQCLLNKLKDISEVKDKIRIACNMIRKNPEKDSKWARNKRDNIQSWVIF
jgi:hypothetical protein